MNNDKIEKYKYKYNIIWVINKCYISSLLFKPKSWSAYTSDEIYFPSFAYAVEIGVNKF